MIRNMFERHDFAVKWSFAEFDGASALIPWAVNNAVMNHKKISALVVTQETMFSPARSSRQSDVGLSHVPTLGERISFCSRD